MRRQPPLAPTVPDPAGAQRPRPAGSATPPGRFADRLTADLPEPARRRLAHAIAPGTPLWQSAELTMRGQIRLGTWRPFTARQVLTPPSGFRWSATARVAGLPVTGYDRYGAGVGRMRWRLLGVVPVMTGSGPDVTRSAAGRLAGEGTCWLPTAFGAAQWSPGPDPDSAVATWTVGGEDEAVRIHVAADGRPVRFLLQRWGNPDGLPFARHPFGVTVEAERTFAGVTIPSAIRAGWWWGCDGREDGEFFRAEITGVTFR